jgi:PAS domain S-box-containing protein
MKQTEKHFLSQRVKEDLENLERYIEEFSVFLPLAICTVNPTGLIVDVNQALKDLIGYNEKDLIGQEIEFLFKDKNSAKKLFNQVLKEGLVQNQEMTLVTRDKKRVPVSVSASVRKDRQDNVIGCFFAISDISQLKKLQESLEVKVRERTKDLEDARKALINMLKDAEEARKRVEEEKSKTRAVLISLTDGLIVFDKEKRITLVNPQAEKILGLKEEQVLNKRIDRIVGFPNLTKLYQVLGREIRWTGQRYELVLEKPLRRFFQVSITPVAVQRELVGLMVILHDITREREIDRMKTEFVSIAAHQLRTPLSAIKWTLRMILDGDVGKISKEQAELLEKGYQSNERMITLINDLLNVARIEEGRFVYNPTPQSLEEIIKKTIDALSGIIEKKKLKLVFKKPKEPLPKVRVDKEKIGLVIQNLLDNAIRFNKPGGKVTVSINYDKINIRIMIQDTGIGIPDSQQDQIFSKFFRADNAVKSETEGTGLGLFICKNIIEAHGGKIWFESKEGQGTTFWFTLPLKL